MKSKLFLFIILFFCFMPLIKADEKELIKYRVHVEDIGWQEYKKDGMMAGTSGMSKRLEAINIKSDDVKIEYKTHVQDYGWEEEYKKDGEISGTTGKSKRLEAIKIRLYGEYADEYDVYYRVHCQNFGWLGWAKNDEPAGSEGFSYRLEAIEIKVLKKEDSFDRGGKAFYKKNLFYKTHVSNYGWTNFSSDGEVSGIRKSGVEAFSLFLSNPEYDGDIIYKTLSDGKWDDFKKNGEMSGTTGKSKSITGISINLTGKMRQMYDVYYRVYIDNKGYLSWVKNGDETGSDIYKIETIEVKLKDKGESEDISGTSFYKSKIKYKTHIQDIGWDKDKYDGETSGTVGQLKRVEAIDISLINQDIDGKIKYKTLIEGRNWEDYKYSGLSGTTGLSKKIEAIKIDLEGEIKNYYDIYYRVHSQNIGWLGWAKNGETSGTIGYDYRVEAIEIKLVSKDEIISIDNPSFYNRDIAYKTHVSNIGWTDYRYDGNFSGVIDQKKGLEAFNIKLLNRDYNGNIEYKTYIENFGWERNFKRDGEISGTTGRSKNIEAVQIRLSGDIEKYFDIYYRTYVEDVGWMGWTKNGEKSGSSGYDKSLEALEIKLLSKNESIVLDSDSYISTNDGYYVIQNNNDKYLDIDGLIKRGEKVFFTNKSELTTQVWSVKDFKNGYSSILSVNPKLSLDKNIKLSRFDQSDSQMWTLKDLGDGYYNIISKYGLYLDSFGRLSEKSDSNDQKFILKKFEGIKTYRGIDISKWQGNIDFNELIKEKPNFIIMRVGTGRGGYEKDSKFDEYYLKASDMDIPVGAYTYSYALNMTEALKEANLTLSWLDNKKLDLPVFYDIENINQTLLGKDVLTKIAITFCDRIIENGYKCGIYANKYFLKDNLDALELSKKYPIWLAHWTGSNNYSEALNDSFHTDYSLTPYNYWQFSSLGVYKGIEENTVDLDFGYDIFD